MTTRAGYWCEGRGVACTAAVLSALMLWPVVLTAQQANFRHYASIEGLPQRQVMAVTQGHTGYMWFGTYGGLSRFDGQDFETYTVEDGLSSNIIADIAEDGHTRFWIGTIGGGVCLMEDGEFDCVRAADGLADDNVTAVHPARDGSVWVATERGVSRITGDSIATFGVEHGLPHATAYDIAETADGTIWAGTAAGLARFDGGRFASVDEPALARSAVRSLLPTPRGLLIGTDRTVYEREGATLRALPIPAGVEGPFSDAALDGAGDVWIASDAGVLRWDGASIQRYTERQGLLTDQVFRVAVDREGTLWFGTDAGISKLVLGPFVFFAKDEGLPHPFVRAITEDASGRIWVGTRAGVAVGEDGRFRMALATDRLPHPRVYALAAAPEGGMLIGTRGGLVHHTPTGTRTYLVGDGLPGEFVTSLLPDSGGGVWVGTEAGVAYWERGRITPFPPGHPLARPFVVSMERDADGRLWVGRRVGGILIWDGRDGMDLGAAEGLSDQTVWSMDRDDAGAMWVGTNGDGVFRVDGDRIRRLATGDGLVDNFVWQVLAGPDGSIWLFTSNGLDRWTRTGFVHYGRGDGLADLEGAAAAALRARDGNLWFGTTSGLTRYDADAERANGVPPPVVIETVTAAGGQPLDPGAELAHDAADLRIDFAALSFRDEQEVRFRYRLSRGSRPGAWSPAVDDRNISYAGLGPGQFTFEVIGINDDGIPSREPAAFSFRVLPAFWQRWWFWTLVIGALLVGVAAIPLLRARSLAKERGRLQQRVKERTGELEQANARLRREMTDRERAESQLRQAQKMEAIGRLAGGVAHDFNNLLTSIMGNADLALSQVDATATVRPELDEIRLSARRASKLVEQLLAFSRKQMIKPEVVELSRAVEEDMGMLRRLIGEDIELAPALEAEGCIRIDRGQLNQVLINLVLNARDAMEGGGRLSIRTANTRLDTPPGPVESSGFEAGHYLMLQVSDTGHGIPAPIRERIFEPFFTTKDIGKGTGLGLATVYGIVKQNGGWITAVSPQGDGATFSIFLPRADAAPPTPPSNGRPGRLRQSDGGVVLAVEDEPAVRDLVRRILARCGYQVHTAADAETALRFLESNPQPIDLLLTDMVMPGQNGRALAERVTADRPGTRVLYISGYTGDALGERGLESQDIALLEKPFDPETLVRRVREVLAG